MIIDSSAILAVIGKEPGYERIVHELAAAPGARIGAPTRLESGIVLTARSGPGARRSWHGSCRRDSIQTVAFDDEHATRHLDAYSRFGKGRHPAALNLGDSLRVRRSLRRRRAASVPRRRLRQDDLPLVSLDTDEIGTDTAQAGEPTL